MVISIIISEDMSRCFNQCARLSNYHPFFEEYRATISTILKYLKSVSCPKELLCNFASMNLKKCIDFLKFHDSGTYCEAMDYLRRHCDELYFDMKYSISNLNWDHFYWDYRSKFDHLIQKSRDQRVIDFYIEYGGGLFEDFESRDLAANFKKPWGKCLSLHLVSVPCLAENSRKPTSKLKSIPKGTVANFATFSAAENPITMKMENPGGQWIGGVGQGFIQPSAFSAGELGSTDTTTEIPSDNKQNVKYQSLEPELESSRQVRLELRDARIKIEQMKTEMADQKAYYEQKIFELEEKQEAELHSVIARNVKIMKKMEAVYREKDEQQNLKIERLMNIIEMVMELPTSFNNNYMPFSTSLNRNSLNGSFEFVPIPTPNTTRREFEPSSSTSSGFGDLILL